MAELKTRLLEAVTPCGDIPYVVLREIMEHLIFDDDQVKLFLLNRLEENKNLITADWRLLFQHVEYLEGLDKEITLGWINEGCKLTREYFKLFIEYVNLSDFNPTYLLTQNG